MTHLSPKLTTQKQLIQSKLKIQIFSPNLPFPSWIWNSLMIGRDLLKERLGGMFLKVIKSAFGATSGFPD